MAASYEAGGALVGTWSPSPAGTVVVFGIWGFDPETAILRQIAATKPDPMEGVGAALPTHRKA